MADFGAGPSKENGQLALKNPELSDVFQGGVFKGKIWGEGCRVCDLLLIGWWWGWFSRNLELSLKLPSSPPPSWVGAMVPAEELRDTIIYIPWGRTRTLPQACIIVSWLLFPCLCIPSLPWLATVWICPLGLREGLGGWSLYPENKKLGTRKGFWAQEPHRVLLGFNIS